MNFSLDIIRTLLGMALLLGVCYLFSRNRKAINWKLVGIGVALQFIMAVLMLKAPGVSVGVDFVKPWNLRQRDQSFCSVIS